MTELTDDDRQAIDVLMLLGYSPEDAERLLRETADEAEPA
jgi:hypothetical protein